MKNSRGNDSGSENSNRVSQRQIQDSYGENALLIARCMLAAHSSGKPVRKRELIDTLKERNGELARGQFQREFEKANSFLKEKLWMQIVELDSVRLHGSRRSAKRDEFMLASLTHGYRSALHKVVSKSQLREWGTACLALSLIVLKGDGIALPELIQAFTASHIYADANSSNGGLDSQILVETLHKLAAQRIFEITKSSLNDSTRGEETPASSERAQEYFFIGPYAKHVISGRELYVIMLKMHFPMDRRNSREFQEAHAVGIRSLKSKIETAALGGFGEDS